MKNFGALISILFLIFSVIIFIQASSLEYSSEYGPGPGFLPSWTSGIMIILSIVYFFISLKKELIYLKGILPNREGLFNVLISIGALTLYIIVTPYLGFTISSALMLFSLFSLGYKWYWSLGMSACLSLLVFWVFGNLLGIPLPLNEYGW
ncbi:tripartite tricarboxylate transporter TctB family protein [Metabacillus herbersteinensis]|uniref:Tripartite tricarboxylate transporter TctB family protein n=1 Tax=Metabacillus herbersteinensis TaxID=283816 RepID=A0ABV6GFB9_9BACI